MSLLSGLERAAALLSGVTFVVSIWIVLIFVVVSLCMVLELVLLRGHWWYLHCRLLPELARRTGVPLQRVRDLALDGSVSYWRLWRDCRTEADVCALEKQYTPTLDKWAAHESDDDEYDATFC